MGKRTRVKKYKKEGRDIEKDIMDSKVYQNVKEDQEVQDLKDEDLFVINEGNTDDIKKARKQLEEDRFRQHNTLRSKNERDQIRDLMKKPQVIEPKPKKKAKKQEMFDIWNTPAESMGVKLSKNKKRDKNILDSRKDRIRRVVVPHAGQSYNPPVAEHKKLIEDVVVEEIEDLRKETQLNQELDPDLRPEMETLEEDLAKLKKFCAEKEKWRYGDKEQTAEKSESEDEDGNTKISVNPPVSREDALSLKQRRLRKIEKEKQREKRTRKKMKQRAHKERPLGKKQKKALAKIRRYNKEKEEKEREMWEKEGVVSKARKLGLYNYSKPKSDFVEEENLPDSLMRQQGTDLLVRDQFNSFYRRNLIPKEAPPKDRKEIKGTIYKEHKSNTHKKLIYDESKKGDVALQQAREKLRQRKRNTALARGLKAPKKTKEEDNEIIMI